MEKQEKKKSKGTATVLAIGIMIAAVAYGVTRKDTVAALALQQKFSPKEKATITKKMKVAEKSIGIENIIRLESKAAGVDPLITLAILHQESGRGLRTDRLRYESHLLSKVKRTPGMTDAEAKIMVTSIGLMQVIPMFHLKRCNLKSYSELFDPEVNIECGLRVLQHCADQHKSKGKVEKLKGALHCYNGSAAYAEEVFQRIAELTIERIG